MKKFITILLLLIFYKLEVVSQPHLFNSGGVSHSSGESFSTTAIIGQSFYGTSRNNSHYFVSGLWSRYLLPPQPPVVYASQGDFPNRNRIEWEFDKLSPPADEQIQILRNGALLTTVSGKITDFQDFNIIAGEIYNYGIKGINEYGTGNPGYDLGFVSPNGTITGTVKTAKGKAVVNSEVKVTPISGSSIKFNSINDYIKIPVYKRDRKKGEIKDSINLKKDFTIEFWFKREGAENNSTINILTTEINKKGIKIDIIGANARIRFDTSLTTNTTLTTTNGDLNNNNWHHVAFTKKYSSGRLAAYIDGELKDTLNIGINKTTFLNTDTIFFGKSANQFFIDEIRLWKSSKNFDELKRDYVRTGSTLDTNLVAYWNLNESVADHVLDLSKNKHHGRLYQIDSLKGLDNIMWQTNFPPIYSSAYSDGNGEFLIEGLAYGGGKSFTIIPEMKVPSGRTFKNIGANKTAFRIPYDSLFPTSVLTVEAWVKPTKFDSIRYILSAAFGGINLGINTDRRVFTKFKNNTTVTSTAQLTINTWTHIAMILDNSGTRFFINGIPSGQNSYKAIEYVRGDSNYILIGGGSSAYFDGLIDEVRFWNIARLQTELEEAKNRKLKGNESGLFSYFHFNEGNGTVAGNLVKSHPNASLIKNDRDTLKYLELDPTKSDSFFSKDIPNKANEDIVHQFIPSQKRVNLNSSITSVDRIEFQDVTVVPISGYIVYQGTECFVDSVEIYVDGKPTEPKTMTNNLGYFSVELDPGRNYRIAPLEKPGKNDFEIKYYDVTNLTEPVSLPMFIDRTKRKLTGLVAAALVDKEIKREINNGLSIKLNGTNNYLRIVHETSANLGNNFTLEAWIYPERTTGTNVIISKTNEYGLAIVDGKLAYRTYANSTNSWVKDTSSATIRLNRWSHVALTHTFTSAVIGGAPQTHTYKLFVNGSKVSTKTTNTDAISGGNRDLYFGADNITSLGNYFSGNLAEIKIWKNANSDSIVNLKKDIRISPRRESNLVAYYTFADENGKSITDKLNSELINSPLIEGFPITMYEILAGGVSAISGSITDRSQITIDDVTRVSVRAANGCLTKTVVVNADGTFEVDNLPPNFYIVSVMHPIQVVTQNVAPKRINILEGNGNVNFDFRAPLNADLSGLQGAMSRKNIIVPDRNSSDKFRNIGKVPILTSSREVELQINIFEDYRPFFKNSSIAAHTNVLDTGSILVVDNISGKPPTWFPVGKNGLSYILNPTDPYIVEGGSNPFQKFISISARDLSGNSIPSPITKFAIVKGSVGKERTFSTTSPVNLDLILHDPPGDQSFVEMTKGFTFATKVGKSSVTTNSIGFDRNAKVGVGVGIFMGLGAGTTMEASAGVTAGIKANFGSTVNSDQSITNTVTMTETFSTESSSDFIGAEGDVFVGHADNVIYGNADILELINGDLWTNDTLKIRTTIFFFPGVPTYFAYPKSFLEENLIPKLRENSQLTTNKKNELIHALPTINSQANTLLTQHAGWDLDTSKVQAIKDSAIVRKTRLKNINVEWYNNHFKSILANHDSSIFFMNWAKNWELEIKLNDSNKIKAKDIAFNNIAPDGKPLDPAWNGENKKNLSFATGSPRKFSMSSTNTFSRTTSNTILINEEAFAGAFVEADGSGPKIESTINLTQEHSSEDTKEVGQDSDSTTEVSYTLQDDDKGDNFTTNVWRDPYFGTPVFELVAAETSCPYEGPVAVGEPSTTGYSTRARDKITLAVEPIRITNIFPGEEAVFKIKLVNTGEVNQDASRTIMIRIPQETNPRGAKIAINGVVVEQFLEVNALRGQEVNLILTIQRGPNTDTDNAPYENLRLEAYACDEDRDRGRVVSEILAPFNFLESCGSVKMEMTVSTVNFGNPWVLSPINADKKDTVKITAYDYNINDPNFTQLEIQYREKPQISGSGVASGVIGQSTVNAIQSKGFSLDSFNWNAVKGGIKPIVIKDDYNSTVYSKANEINYSDQSENEIKTNGSKEKTPPTILGDPRWIRLPIGKNSEGQSQDFVTIDSLRNRSIKDQFDYFLSLQNPFPILDGSYEFRVVAVCNKGLVPGMSEIYTGVIDRQGPKVIRREPHDGVLQENDEISILFDEKIDKNDIEKNLPLRVLLENEETNLPVDYNAIVHDNKISIIPKVQMSILESKTLRVQIVTLEQIAGKMVPKEGEIYNRPLDIYSTPTPSRSETKWSFYVDQSPIKWNEDQITITTTADKNFEPKIIKLNNNSGSIVNYSLSNFPSWMEITPKAGSLSPGSSEDITIQIRSSEVGIGEKNTTLVVTTSYGVEQLKIRTRKIATPPTWTVNPSNFENVMNMIAEVNLPSSGRIETGHALSFNGTNSIVTVPNNSALNISDNFTIESWLLLNSKTSKLTPASNWHTIVTKGSNTQNATNDYSLAIETGATNSRLGFFIHGIGTAYSNNFTFELNQFYHIAATRSNGIITFYLNGIQVGSQSGFAHNAINSSTLKIGSGIISTTVAGVTLPAPAMVSGVIDEFRFWNVGRSSVEINNKMETNLIGNESGLIAYYKFDETSGTTVSDLTANRFNGTATSSSVWTTNAPLIGSSRSFVASNDELDMVAAFVGSDIRGVGAVRYVPEKQKYLTFLPIYSNNVTGEDLTFRVWDASAGIEWIRTKERYRFVKDTIVGSVTSPAKISIDPAVEKMYALNTGWNWLSLNTTPVSLILNDVFNGPDFRSSDIIKNQTQFAVYSRDTSSGVGSWNGTLTTFNTTSLYMSRNSVKVNLKVTGSPLVPETTPISLSKGWNWIGFTPQSPIDIQLALVRSNDFKLRTGDIIRSQTAFSSYQEEGGWIGNLNTLEPLKGYQLKMQDDNPGALIYPTPLNISTVATVAGNLQDSIPATWNLNPAMFQYSMTLVGTVILDGKDTISQNDFIGAFFGDECRGVGNAVFVPALNKFRMFLVSYSNNLLNDSLAFKYYSSKTKKEFLLNEKIIFKANDNIGTIANPIQFTISGLTRVEDEIIPKEFALHQNYPNPFNPSTTIKYDLPTESNVTITIYSVLGQKIKTVVNEVQKAGFKKVVWNGTNDLGVKVASGIYIYRITAGKFISNKKMILLK